jgi:hypothetical protein
MYFFPWDIQPLTFSSLNELSKAPNTKGPKLIRRTWIQTFVCVLYEADRLCGLVVRVLGYRSGGPGSIPGTTRFSEKKNK